MKEHKEDFELFVINKLMEIGGRISKLEGRAATFGAIAGILASVIGEAVVKAIWHQ